MDPVTHGLLGALVAQAAPRGLRPPRGMTRRGAVVACTAAALFPDIDYLLFWIHPLHFLSDWHRGLTHSLVMLPLWALLLGLLFARCGGGRHTVGAYTGLCALGLASHIAIDLPTAYGIQLFAPLSDFRFALAWSFLVDPYLTAMGGVALLIALRSRSGWRRALVARTGLLALGLYLGLLGLLHERAKAVVDAEITRRELSGARSHALPQPFSPLNWKLVIQQEQGYWIGHAHLYGDPLIPAIIPWPPPLARLSEAYEPTEALVWRLRSRFGAPEQRHLVEQVWRQPALAAFRRFARLPALTRLDRDERGDCVWFTDLRYTLPELLPFFRYGLCRPAPELPWQLYRLRRHHDDLRQRID